MKGWERCKPWQAGVTLLELLIAIAVLGIIISVAMPSFSEFGQTQRLIGAAEQVYGHIQQARSEAVTRSTNTYANFAVDGSASWEYGVSVSSLCDLTLTDPATANACVIVVDDGDGVVDPGDGSVDTGDLVLMRFTSTDYDGVTMNIANFSSGSTQFVFDPVRGTSTSGEVNLASAGGKQLRVKVSLLGRVTLCSPDGSIPNYSSAGC
ncbi:MAG: GspH/FimT family pseudopilin [Pseudohongiellaceae bacterium]